jgi:Ni2+-binding GTPase involved in maturation of urease and hydrogenase
MSIEVYRSERGDRPDQPNDLMSLWGKCQNAEKAGGPISGSGCHLPLDFSSRFIRGVELVPRKEENFDFILIEVVSFDRP